MNDRMIEMDYPGKNMDSFKRSRIEKYFPPIICWCENIKELEEIEKHTTIYFSKFPDERKFPLFIYRTKHIRLNIEGNWTDMFEQDIQHSYNKDTYSIYQLRESFDSLKETYELTEVTGVSIKKDLPEYFI